MLPSEQISTRPKALEPDTDAPQCDDEASLGDEGDAPAQFACPAELGQDLLELWRLDQPQSVEGARTLDQLRSDSALPLVAADLELEIS